jgi:ATP-binding cassette subfamily C (CFTR/MRP) protein 1
MLIYWQIGYAAFIGLSYCLFVIPLSMFLIKTVGGKFKIRLKIGDKRLKYINEMFQGIRVIKYFAWEEAFISKIEVLRDQEQEIAKYTARLTSLALYMQQSLPAWIPIIIFGTYIGLGNELSAVQAFVVLQLIMLLAGPLNKLISVGNSLSMAMASSVRVSQFLFREDIHVYINADAIVIKTLDEGALTDREPTAVRFHDACLGWLKESTGAHSPDGLEVSLHSSGRSTKPVKTVVYPLKKSSRKEYEMVNVDDHSIHGPFEDSQQGELADAADSVNRGIYTLRGINASIKRGQLVAIVGPIGSGKSSLLSALLNELHLQDGSVSVRGSMAYHQQNPWIFNSSLKRNILFGLEFNQPKFDAVIAASSLLTDVGTLSHGWDTEIGEKGINLSGGQKARISFSRALYADADVYLLDDPLSAVDAHVGFTMFYEGIKRVLAGKTVLLATHQTQFLKDCDLIMIMADGRVCAIDTYDNLIRRGIDVESYHDKRRDHEGQNDNVYRQRTDRDTPTGGALVTPIPHRPSVSDPPMHAISVSPTYVRSPSLAVVPAPGKGTSISGELKNPLKVGGGLMSAEFKAKGRIRWKTYWFYISRGRPEIYVLMISIVLVSQVLSIYANMWLSLWGEASSSSQQLNQQQLSKHENYYYLTRYTVLACFGSCTGLINMNLNVEHRTKAAKFIHKELLSKVLSASISFFDTTPVGRIMNVFSNDIRTIDLQIGMTMAQFIVTWGQLAGTISILTYTTKGTFLVALVPLFLVYSYFQRYFQTSNLELKRLDSIANSPIVSSFTEVLSGLTCVRAYDGKEREYLSVLNKAVLKESTIFYIQQLLDQWKQVRLDIAGSCIALFIYILAASTRNFISPRLLLVAVTYSNILPIQCSNMVTILSTVESSFNSVERIMHYVEDIKSEEEEAEAGTDRVPASNDWSHDDSWPTKGEISFQDIELGYRDGPNILHKVSAAIQSKAKIGIVGRSGSGKSTLMLALFRFENLRR